MKSINIFLLYETSLIDMNLNFLVLSIYSFTPHPIFMKSYSNKLNNFINYRFLHQDSNKSLSKRVKGPRTSSAPDLTEIQKENKLYLV